MNDCIEKFHTAIEIGPIFICSCCEQTWSRQSVSEATCLSKEEKEKYFTTLVSVDAKHWICTTCKVNIAQRKIPKLSVINSMQWPVKPKELDLFH